MGSDVVGDYDYPRRQTADENAFAYRTALSAITCVVHPPMDTGGREAGGRKPKGISID